MSLTRFGRDSKCYQGCQTDCSMVQPLPGRRMIQKTERRRLPGFPGVSFAAPGQEISEAVYCDGAGPAYTAGFERVIA